MDTTDTTHNDTATLHLTLVTDDVIGDPSCQAWVTTDANGTPWIGADGLLLTP